MLPMNIESWDQHDTMSFAFEGVMTEDFGPWKKGEKHELFVNYEKGIIQEYDPKESDQVTLIHSVRVKLVIG